MGRLDFSQRKIKDRQNRYISALIKPYILQIKALPELNQKLKAEFAEREKTLLDIIRKQQLLIDDLKAQ